MIKTMICAKGLLQSTTSALIDKILHKMFIILYNVSHTGFLLGLEATEGGVIVENHLGWGRRPRFSPTKLRHCLVDLIPAGFG